mmetsp:Transcript_3230/g.7439  ORF Transcript_3230/g.7439 Transcript_3230/m.7439 type:complete len:231 (+) Transcript_3230:90-782(+)
MLVVISKTTTRTMMILTLILYLVPMTTTVMKPNQAILAVMMLLITRTVLLLSRHNSSSNNNINIHHLRTAVLRSIPHNINSIQTMQVVALTLMEMTSISLLPRPTRNSKDSKNFSMIKKDSTNNTSRNNIINNSSNNSLLLSLDNNKDIQRDRMVNIHILRTRTRRRRSPLRELRQGSRLHHRCQILMVAVVVIYCHLGHRTISRRRRMTLMISMMIPLVEVDGTIPIVG